MALPPFLSIDGADPAQQNQTLTGDNTNESFVLESTGGLGTIRGFKIKGEGGNDTLTLVGAPNGTNLFGGDGEDLLTIDNKGTGSIVNTKVFGGSGNDTVRLVDVLMTGTGNGLSQIGTAGGGDEIELGGSFFNTNFFTGEGNDLLTFVSKSSFKNDSRAFTGAGDDTLTDGGFQVDFTNSTFGTKGGNDFVDFSNSFTGQDADGMEMFLGEGDDTFIGPASGDVTLFGGAGDDEISTFDGDDSILAGEGNDTVQSGKGNDTVSGGGGNDLIHGDDGQDSLFGDAGSDVIFGENDNDTIDGGADADFIGGGFGDDSISGGSGAGVDPDPDEDDGTIFSEDDTLIGNVGNDTIRGESGNDIIWAGSFNNLGFDTDEVEEIIEDKFDLEEVDLGATPLTDEEAFDKINPKGDGPNDQDDSVLGNSGNDIIFGSAGDDTLLGNSGNDVIMGNRDSDSMTGGSGHDIFIQSEFDSSDADGLSVGDNLTISFGRAKIDVITDFLATDGAGNVVDKIAFETGGGTFRNNLGSATAGFAAGNIVIYSGIYNANNNTFITTDNSVGPDVLAFESDGSTPGFGGDWDTGDFGTQAVALLGASGQAFSEDNFITFT